MNKSRRGILGAAAMMPLLVLGFGSAARAKSAACFDLDSLPSGQQSLRRTLGFKAKSDDPEKHCGICAFFKATEGDCGTCQLLSGGAVSTESVCNSFAKKS